MEFMVLNEVRSPSRISEKRKYLVRQKATEENTPNTFTRETLSLSPSNCKVSSVFSFRSETEAPKNNRPLLSHSYRTLSADYRPPEARLSVQRQKTADSAPSRVSSRGSSRQHSLSQGHSRVTLIRGESCSLVDIPTYLGSSVELGQLGSLRNPPIQLVFASNRPRLRIDLTKKKPDKSAKKTQWTVLCVAVAMMTMCVMLVGTMLSITSEYQVTIKSSSSKPHYNWNPTDIYGNHVLNNNGQKLKWELLLTIGQNLYLY